MSTNHCSPAVLKVLVSVFYGGLDIDARSDSEDLLLALRTMMEPGAFLEMCEARMRIRSKDWSEASRILLEMEAQGDGSPVVSALRGLCLKMLGDDDWRRCADSAVESGDVTGIAVVARFLGVHEGSADAHPDALATRIHQTLRSVGHV